MTSAVRIVSPAAIHNGPVVSALLADLCRDEPIEVLAEVATGAVRVEPGGEPLRSLALVAAGRAAAGAGRGGAAVRGAVRALARHRPGVPRRRSCPTATRSPASRRLIAFTLPPLLRLLHRGVALEAHGQNLLVVLRDRRSGPAGLPGHGRGPRARRPPAPVRRTAGAARRSGHRRRRGAAHQTVRRRRVHRGQPADHHDDSGVRHRPGRALGTRRRRDPAHLRRPATRGTLRTRPLSWEPRSRSRRPPRCGCRPGPWRTSGHRSATRWPADD